MKQEILDWYAERHFQLHKMVHMGLQRGLNRTQVEAAMTHCWKKIQEGKPIQDIDVARYVFNVGKVVDDTIYKKRLEIIDELEARASRAEICLRIYSVVFCLVNLFLYLNGSF